MVIRERFVEGKEEPVARFFTPEEANAALPQVREPLELAVRTADELRAIARAAEEAGSLKGEELRRAERLRDAIRDLLEQIKSRGIEVKGLDTGLIDFPAIRNGRFVYLCWRIGEQNVEWWHPVHTGFAGRQKITKGDGTCWEWRN
jgi:hypothetical protein